MQSKKTIFILINALGPGGAERVTANILPELSKKYSVHLILLKDELFYDLPRNVKILTLSKIKQNFLILPLFPSYIFKLKRLIKQHQPDKVISFLEIANFINILSNKKAIISFRTSLFFFKKGIINKIYKILIKLLYPHAKKIIVNSKENRLDLSQKLSVPLNKITTIYNPIDIKKIDSLKNKSLQLPFAKEANQKIFITIGRFDVLKNISMIIETFRNLPKKNILLIIGDGPEKENLQKLINQYQLQKQVFLLGQQKNVYKYLNISDYFIFASQVEGFPNVLIEAMTCNLPIITSDFKTGAREIINPELSFNKKIKYPHYGPNGVFLSLENFEKDFQKINFNQLTQKKVNFNQFELKKIITKWRNLIKFT